MKKFVLSAALLFLPWRGMLKAFHPLRAMVKLGFELTKTGDQPIRWIIKGLLSSIPVRWDWN